MSDAFIELGVAPFVVLLPKDRGNLEHWCVIACDQYTSDAAYWKQVEEVVGEHPSTLRMVLPEYYLDSFEEEKRINTLVQNMESYLCNGVFEELSLGFLLVERTFQTGKTRKGLLLSLDLEQYDYSKDSLSAIRATEGTIEERIPPRLRVRKNAPIELPHIMVLLDDREKKVLEPLFEKRDSFLSAYDSRLLYDMGSIKGWHIPLQKAQGILDGLTSYCETRRQASTLLYAMGDGNHSLATAKSHWEDIKKTLTMEEQRVHPARFPLVELVNLYDEGILFEAIHRVVFMQDADCALQEIAAAMRGVGYPIEEMDTATEDIKNGHVLGSERKGSVPVLCRGGDKAKILDVFGEGGVPNAIFALDYGIAHYLQNNPHAKVDYVHGAGEALSYAEKGSAVAFVLPPMQKEDLFPYVEQNGPLPRKTFSMGEAQEKRCYLEARKIR